ncbi:hypothetical protein [Leptothermofonsia sp. ETS-13]|uniref:hypothetical protein n=1 Tax=Leptothermofonsia sp. ETS-13 TaxID=3035696 RepID=UPI003BA0B75F
MIKKTHLLPVRPFLAQYAVYSSLVVLWGTAIAHSANANPAPARFIQSPHGLTIIRVPISHSGVPDAGGNVSSSSYSSTFVNNSGAGASSGATVTSPAGTTSSNKTVFTPGATSASASATATASTTGPNLVNITANTSSTAQPVPLTIPSFNTIQNSGNPGPENPTTAISTLNTLQNPPSIALPTVPLSLSVNGTPNVVENGLVTVPASSSSPATFIQSFAKPISPPAVTSGPYRVVGLPSRVFPGLGLRYVPED